jgi:Flp pilus assembly protein TadD
LGIACSKVGDVEKATAAFQRAATLAPSPEHAARTLAKMEKLTGQQPEAMDIESLGSDVLGLLAAVQIAHASKDYEKAIDLCNRVIALDPNEATAWRILSSSYHRSGRDQDALVPAKRVVDLLPKDAKSWYILGRRYSKLGHNNEATGAFRQALTLFLRKKPRNQFWIVSL